jgi:hypothetical protein
MYIVAENVILERDIPDEAPLQLDFFSDPTEQEKKREKERAADMKATREMSRELTAHSGLSPFMIRKEIYQARSLI